MKVLVTGVAGLLGSRLSDWILASTDSEVIGIDDLSGGYKDNIQNKVKFYCLNLADDDIDSVFLEHKPDIVYHFAAYAAEGLSPFMRQFNYKNNLISTVNIINCCINHSVKRLVFTSSMAVYGQNVAPFDESLVPCPIDPYGIAKYSCEQDIKVAGVMHGLDWCIIRPHNVFGEKQNIWDMYRNVLGIWMYQHLNGMPLSIFGDGEQKRAFSYIGNCLEPLWKAGTDDRASRQIINLGGKIEHTINEISDMLLEIIGNGSKIHLEPRHEVKLAWSTYEKSIKLIDYEEKILLEEGLKNMWSWASLQPMRDRKHWGKYEINRGVYDFWRKK